MLKIVVIRVFLATEPWYIQFWNEKGVDSDKLYYNKHYLSTW